MLFKNIKQILTSFGIWLIRFLNKEHQNISANFY